MFSLRVTSITSCALFGDKLMFPVIIIYFAGILVLLLIFSYVFKSKGSIGGVSNNEFVLLYLVNPISSRANAIGITPPAIYFEYINTIPVEFFILSQIAFIFAL